MHKKELALLGEVEGIELVAGLLEKELSHCLVGYFATGGDPQPVRLDRGGTLQPLGCIADLKQVLISKAIQAVLMVLPPGEAPWLEEAVRACDYFRVAAHIVPQVVLTARLDDLVSETSGLSGKVPTLSLVPGEAHDDWLFVKRVMDVCIGGLLLVLLSPIFLLIAIAIKLTTPHLPVFYPWRVVGNRGRRFTGYKFTTMVADADAQRESLASLNEMTGPVFKIAKDPRITPLGKFLRRFSLNELPQLWSVFKGDMSLVGPRPAGPHELERYELWQKRKLSAQPGITCFWQVQGRNRISSFDDWVRLDLEYIQRRSLWLDCTILAKTFWVVIRGTGS
jgi:lipopolysaccharide/colanic/teichoic acid biosynthesis glycosyltransferase